MSAKRNSCGRELIERKKYRIIQRRRENWRERMNGEEEKPHRKRKKKKIYIQKVNENKRKPKIKGEKYKGKIETYGGKFVQEKK